MAKKGKKKKNAAPKEPPTDFDDHTIEALEELVPQMTTALAALSNTRNYSQLERDTTANFRKMTLDKVEALATKSKLLDIELEEQMENHRVELEVYAHKVWEDVEIYARDCSIFSCG
jgi:uncharacterized protein (DUF342 family)